MTCVLLNRDDTPGLWLFRSLQTAGRKDLRLISAEELAYAPSFGCGFRNGKAFFSILLQSGFEFSNETVSAVINRIQVLPMQQAQRFKEEDREYVQTELTAVWVFLFSILPNVVFNATTPAGFCGRIRSPIEWTLLARQSGFETQEIVYEHQTLQHFPGTRTPSFTILYFHQKCYAPAFLRHPLAVECSLLLGKLSGEKILEITLGITGNKPFFIAASTHPSFQNIGNDFIADLNLLL